MMMMRMRMIEMLWEDEVLVKMGSRRERRAWETESLEIRKGAPLWFAFKVTMVSRSIKRSCHHIVAFIGFLSYMERRGSTPLQLPAAAASPPLCPASLAASLPVLKVPSSLRPGCTFEGQCHGQR